MTKRATEINSSHCFSGSDMVDHSESVPGKVLLNKRTRVRKTNMAYKSVALSTAIAISFQNAIADDGWIGFGGSPKLMNAIVAYYEPGYSWFLLTSFRVIWANPDKQVYELNLNEITCVKVIYGPERYTSYLTPLTLLQSEIQEQASEMNKQPENLPEHHSAVRSMTAKSKGREYRSVKSLAEANFNTPNSAAKKIRDRIDSLGLIY